MGKRGGPLQSVLKCWQAGVSRATSRAKGPKSCFLALMPLFGLLTEHCKQTSAALLYTHYAHAVHLPSSMSIAVNLRAQFWLLSCIANLKCTQTKKCKYILIFVEKDLNEHESMHPPSGVESKLVCNTEFRAQSPEP